MRSLGTVAIASAGFAMLGAVSVLAASKAAPGGPARAVTEGMPSNAPARMEWTDDGAILVTPAGITLYTNGGDGIGLMRGKSTCTNVPAKTYREEQAGMGPAPLIGANIHKSCAQKWPPYLANAGAQPLGDFTLVDRPEGEVGKQWRYRDFPLYTSARDKQPGDRLGVSGGGFGGNFGGRGFRFAMVPLDFPAGLKFTRLEEGLVLTTPNGRLVYARSGARVTKACVGCDANEFQPIFAPALAKASGDWSIVDAGPGRRQFAFQGKPLFAAPESLKESEIAKSGEWEMVVMRKGPGRPTQIGTHLALIGDVYTDKTGLTLYTFNCNSPARDGVRCDEPGDPAGYWVALCGDAKECARRWRPYLATPEARPVGLWSVVDVAYPMFTTNPGIIYPPEAPRVKAWAYRGTPVYTYYEDKGPGDMWGDGIKWIGGSNFSALRMPGRSILD